MGGAAMIGLGLAIAGPDRRVLVVTGDGEMLMGLGSLATVGVQRPPNLAIAVFDNARYAETGMQASHTDHGVSLCGVARSCGIEGVYDITDNAALQDFARLVHTANRALFARIAIKADEPPPDQVRALDVGIAPPADPGFRVGGDVAADGPALPIAEIGEFAAADPDAAQIEMGSVARRMAFDAMRDRTGEIGAVGDLVAP